MTQFISLPRHDGTGPVLLWEEVEGALPKVLSQHLSVDEIENAEELQVWRMDCESTADVGSPLNAGRYPLLDADGVPLWSGAQITFQVQSHYINVVGGSGVFTKADLYGGAYFVSDQPLNVYDLQGFARDRRREQYTSLGKLQSQGVCQGMRLLSSSLGDPHEHGKRPTFIQVAEDVRLVSVLEYDPVASPILA